MRSTGIAIILCILNILIPGLGTLLSTCFSDIDKKNKSPSIVPEVEPEDEEAEEEKLDEENEESQDKKILTEASKNSNSK